MRSALTFLLIAAVSLLVCSVSSAQTIEPQTGAVCEELPADLRAVQERAEAGDAIAQYERGRSMLSPRPTDSEFETAMPWFRRSAEQGYAPAEYFYGGIFREGRWKNPQQLLYWWTKAAEQGEVRAQLWLGLDYEQGGDGVGRDYAQALQWLSMAAKQGQPDAQVALGQMYEDGEGVPQDYHSAAYWYRKAADHIVDLGGAGQGANRLTELYEHGHATPQDYVFVYVWYALTNDADGLRELTKRMNPTQLAEAQRKTMDWYHRHPPCSPAANHTLPVSQSQ